MIKHIMPEVGNFFIRKYFLEVQFPCCLSVFVWLGSLLFFSFFNPRREQDDSSEWIESLLEEYCFRMDYI